MQSTAEARGRAGWAGFAVTSARERDADFSAYLAARQPALLRTAYLLTGSRADAEDLVQTSLAKLYLAWDRVREREAVDAYARRILLNEHHSLWRRAWRRRELPVEQVPEGDASSDAHVDAYDDGRDRALWTFVQTLPRRQRAVVVLRYYEELSEAETADVLGVSVGTVKSQCSRALAALRARAPRSLDPGPEQP
jgi:RNA polymerase sigma-70 factor (sigma-E family)